MTPSQHLHYLLHLAHRGKLFSETGVLLYEGPFVHYSRLAPEPTKAGRINFSRRRIAQALRKAHARVRNAPEVVTTWHGLLEHEKYAPGAEGYFEAERSFNEAAL